MRWIRERVKTSWDWNSMLLKDLLNFQYHLRIYMNKRKSCREEFNASWDYTKD
jgi:hypothetical protein